MSAPPAPSIRVPEPLASALANAAQRALERNQRNAARQYVDPRCAISLSAARRDADNIDARFTEWLLK